MSSGFKVRVEPLATARIKQINYEGEEIYQEKPTSSQTLTDLAKRVDFTDLEDDETSEEGPSIKKSTDRWPWEDTHSKLKQALMEVNVMADLLKITQEHKQYVMLDPVLQQPNIIKPSYQLYAKKKALASAAEILQEGAKNLNAIVGVPSSDHFHKSLLKMRKSWKLKRMGAGITGDLSYRNTAGWINQLPSTFAVHKGDKEPIVVTLPREIQGKSELLVFLEPHPVKNISKAQQRSFIGYLDDLHGKHLALPPWEQKLKAAQKVIFNHELFSQLSRDAYHQKAPFPYEILTQQIHIPLRKDCWISIHHLREPLADSVDTNEDGVKPNWELTVSLLQSLRRLRSHRFSPRPAIAPSDNSVAAIAGPQALTANQTQEADQKQTLFEALITKARHLDSVECVKMWMDQLVSESRDPLLALSWLPDLSSMKVIVFLHIKLHSNEKDSHSIEVEILADNKLIVKNGTTTMELTVDKERLCRCVRQQILIYQLDVARKEAQNSGWETLQYNPYCLAVIPGNEQVYGRYNTEASVIVIETSDASIKLSLSLEWGGCKVELTRYSQADHSSSDHHKPLIKKFELDHQFGSCFKEKFTQLLTWTRNDRISFLK